MAFFVQNQPDSYMDTYTDSSTTYTKYTTDDNLSHLNLNQVKNTDTHTRDFGTFGGGESVSENVMVFQNDSQELFSFNDTYEDYWNETEDYYLPYGERPETYIVPVLFAIIFIIGILGNGTLILIFLRHRAMRNVPNIYICSLAIGDLLVIFFCVPFTSTVYTFESWPYGEIVCKFSEFIKDISIGVSVFTLTALSADRYFAIVDPMRKLTGHRANKVTCIAIFGIWIVSILIALPSALFSHLKVIEDDPERPFEVCYPFPIELGPNYAKFMVMFKFLSFYAIPLLFIATFYILMAHHLLLSTKNFPSESQGQSAKQIQGRKKVAKMILSFVVIFALCFFPSHVFLLWFYFDPNSQMNFNAYWNLLRIIGFCLGFFNSCLNPITLYCVSKTFRKQFNQHLLCCLYRDGSRRDRSHAFGCGCATISTTEQLYPGGLNTNNANNRRNIELHRIIPENYQDPSGGQVNRVIVEPYNHHSHSSENHHVGFNEQPVEILHFVKNKNSISTVPVQPALVLSVHVVQSPPAENVEEISGHFGGNNCENDYKNTSSSSKSNNSNSSDNLAKSSDQVGVHFGQNNASTTTSNNLLHPDWVVNHTYSSSSENNLCTPDMKVSADLFFISHFIGKERKKCKSVGPKNRKSPKPTRNSPHSY